MKWVYFLLMFMPVYKKKCTLMVYINLLSVMYAV